MRKSVVPVVIAIALSSLSSRAETQAQLGEALRYTKPPATGSGSAPVIRASVPPIDIQDRADVVAFYDAVYKASNGVDAYWTGDVGTCKPGTTSIAYEDATLLRLNYFRAMAGLPGDVVLSSDWNIKCQAAALIMIAEGSLSHSPPASWACYSEDGATAAGKSNLALGRHGPAAIDLYINDSGANNTAVGHRRWILYPRQETMGTGSVTASNGWYHGANALWVIGGAGDRPSAPEWVSWPPPGYVPYTLVYARWSFSHPAAGFGSATITMTHQGSSIDVQKLPVKNGYADNTVVWEPEGIPTTRPTEDLTYTVTIGNIDVGGTPRQFVYDVTIIDPAALPPSSAKNWVLYR